MVAREGDDNFLVGTRFSRWIEHVLVLMMLRRAVASTWICIATSRKEGEWIPSNFGGRAGGMRKRLNSCINTEPQRILGLA